MSENVPGRTKGQVMQTRLVILLLCAATSAMAEESPRFLYVEQEAEELDLQGDAETRRETAALLPLRRACAALREGREPIARPDGHYINGLLLTIEQKGWVSPLPLLATALEVDYRHGGRVWPILGNVDPVARTWLRLAVRDMTVTEKSAFVLRILDGRESSVRPAMIKAVTPSIEKLAGDIRKSDGTGFRDAVVALLAERKYPLDNQMDCDRAELFAGILGQAGGRRTEDAKRIYQDQVPFNLLVLLSPGARLRIADGMEDIFAQCCRRLWKLEGASFLVQRTLRRAVTGNEGSLAGRKGSDAFILELLKDIYESPDGTAGRYDSLTILMAEARAIVFDLHRPLSPELHAYLQRIAKEGGCNPESRALPVDSADSELIAQEKRWYSEDGIAIVLSMLGFVLAEQDRLLASAKENPEREP